MNRNTLLACSVLCSQVLGLAVGANAQTTLDSPAAKQKVGQLIQDVLLPEATLEVDPRHSKLVRTKKPVSRFSITNPEILEVVQFSPSEFELIGLTAGETTFTLWFGEDEVLRYLVTVKRDTNVEDQRKQQYLDLEKMVSEMFPNSVIHLVPIADKLIVRGQARDNEEAARIISVLTNQTSSTLGNFGGGLLGVRLGNAASPYPGESELPTSGVINMLDVPGEKQIMLKVRVAELTRSALRQMGFDLNVDGGDFMWEQMLGVAGAFRAVLDTNEVMLAMSAISSNSYSKILAEPNLVTLSGRSASFIAGGEFAVPIVVGVEGAAAATTNFRGFGTQVQFTPTVIDKDLIRLQVSPSVSSLNQANAVNGIPGLDTRAVTTTVDLREGQWLAIAGLIQDSQTGSKARVPGLGDIPILDSVFSQKSVQRDETELIIMVSPELVHPLDDDEAPTILPGMEVTEPGDWQFFLWGNYEGHPTCNHRSTVWNVQMRRGLVPKLHQGFESSQAFYMNGESGFSE
ncbi:MAG: pilus assembly protein N-terminal domain-containing protein [Planctomycetales bacterium]|nr:pilus assembly protein N-terminal domain-containing protein [Planctomycetales bacterium]